MEVEINNLRQRLVKLLEEDTSLSHTGLLESPKELPISENRVDSQIRVLQGTLIPLLFKLNTVSHLLESLSSGESGSELTTSTADEKLQALVKQKEELSRGLNSLLNAEDVDCIGAMYTKLATDINTALTAVDAVSEMYDKVRSLRKQIDSGRQEQITAQRRIANEMENLNRTSMRIVEELEYIKSEREKIRFRAATEFHPVPLPELLTVRGGDCNTAWRSLYDKGTVGQVYN